MPNFNIWGNVGNSAYSMPMVKLTPLDPTTQNYLMFWNSTEGGIDYASISYDPVTFEIGSAGGLTLAAGRTYKIGTAQVVGPRITGWQAATGTATRTTFATDTVTTTQLAERVKALIDDLTTHGLIGA